MVRFPNTLIIYIAVALISAGQAEAQVSFSSSEHSPVEITPEASTGLDKVYVLWSGQDSRISYQATSENVSWEKYGSLGGGFAEDAKPTRAGNVYTVQAEGDTGYIITDGSRRTCFWVVDYTDHYLRLIGLTQAAEQNCDVTTLAFTGDAQPITYYSTNGAPCNLSRELQLTYSTLVYDAEQKTYNRQEQTRTLASVGDAIRVRDVWCDTQFHLSGDRFLSAWGFTESIQTETVTATAVTAETSATVHERESDNEQPSETGAIGGSAPTEVTFTATVSDAAVFTEWEMAADENFENVEDRFNQTEFTYTFQETGRRYIRFNCADASGVCTYTSGAYEVEIGESALLCPNAFSPLNDDGVNDEWRVSYKSIVRFDCHIFNRRGKELAHLTDPSQGWDGTCGGRKVPAGVYFYAINATGSDGKQYNLSGHINIIGQGSATGTPTATTPEE